MASNASAGAAAGGGGAAAAAAVAAVAALPAVAEPKVVVYERLNPFTTTLNAITRAAGVAPTVIAAAKAEADAAAAPPKPADAAPAGAVADGAAAPAAGAVAAAGATGSLPSDAALHDLLGYLSDANHKLYALRHNLIATAFALYRACKSLPAHESTRVVLVRILQSLVVASEGRQYLFRHGVLELLALLEDDAAPVRQAACRVLFTLSGFPDVTKQLLDKRQVLQALTRAFLFDEAAVALETLPTFAVLSRHDPAFLTHPAMRKLADTLRAFSAVGDDHSAMQHCTAILQCLVHATGGDHTLAQTEMAVALKLVDTVAHILLTTADRKLFPALPPAPVVEPAAAAPADGGAAASVITPRQPESGWALSASSLAAAKEELRRLSSACLLTLTVALSGKMALIGFHSPRAIEYLCHLAMDPGTSAAVRANAIHTIRNIAEHPTGLHAAGVHLLRKSELIYSILGAALTATVVSSLLDDARSGDHALSALSLLCTTGESTRATAWSRILELVPRLVGRLTAPHAPEHTRHTASRCLYLVCTENPDALNELNKAVAAPGLRAEVLKFASDPLRELIRTGDTAALAQLSKEKAAASASAAAAGSAAVPTGALPSPKHRLSQNQSQLHTALHKSILTGDLPAAAAPANSAKPAVL